MHNCQQRKLLLNATEHDDPWLLNKFFSIRPSLLVAFLQYCISTRFLLIPPIIKRITRLSILSLFVLPIRPSHLISPDFMRLGIFLFSIIHYFFIFTPYSPFFFFSSSSVFFSLPLSFLMFLFYYNFLSILSKFRLPSAL